MPDDTSNFPLTRNSGFTLSDGSGRIVASIDPEAAMSMMRMMGISPAGGGGGGGGGNSLAQLGDGVQLGVTAVEAIGIRDDVEDAQDALHQLHDNRKLMYKFLIDSAKSGVGIDAAKFAELMRAIDVSQDELDRAQIRAQNKSITVLWTQVFGAGARILGNMSTGAGNIFRSLFDGGGMGAAGSGIGDALLGGSIGALLASIFTRRQRQDREDRSNVPPLPVG